jgi:hypothetical protein
MLLCLIDNPDPDIFFLDKVVWNEVVQFKNRIDGEGKGFDPEYWVKVEANA